MRKRIMMVLLCGTLFCLPLAGCNAKNNTSDPAQNETSASQETATTKNINIAVIIFFWNQRSLVIGRK